RPRCARTEIDRRGASRRKSLQVIRQCHSGQGEVFLACDATKAAFLLLDFAEVAKFLNPQVPNMVQRLGDGRGGDARIEPILVDERIVAALARVAHDVRFGALKVLKEGETAWV